MGNNEPSKYSRRELAQRGAVAGGVLLSGGLLASCGGDSRDKTGVTSALAPSTAAPKKGGVLRVGVSGGGSGDTLDPAKALSYADFLRVQACLYETLIDYDERVRSIPALAEEMAPNEKGDEWTVRLRQGVEFHNGKTLDADDVISSVRRPSFFSSQYKTLYGLDLQHGLVKLDKRTVRFKLERPFATFREAALPQILPADFDVAKPVGTGPFKFKRFSPGNESVFEANPNYWGTGPYVDELRIIDFPDDVARVNALLANQVDAIDNIPAGQIAVIEKNDAYSLISLETANWQPIGMRVDRAPFDDVRVRQAFRFMADREQLVELATLGHGVVANDLHNRYDPCYPTDFPQRRQDLDRAKSLLKQAGRAGLSVELVTAPIQRGVVELCQAFAQQAKQAGVNVKVTKLDPTTFYNNQYFKRPFSVDWWVAPYEYLNTVALAEAPTSPANATHFNNPRFNALNAQALQTVDETKRCAVIHEMHRISYEEGGFLIPYFPNSVDAVSTKTTGWGNWKTGFGLNGGNLELISFV